VHDITYSSVAADTLGTHQTVAETLLFEMIVVQLIDEAGEGLQPSTDQIIEVFEQYQQEVHYHIVLEVCEALDAAEQQAVFCRFEPVGWDLSVQAHEFLGALETNLPHVVQMEEFELAHRAKLAIGSLRPGQ